MKTSTLFSVTLEVTDFYACGVKSFHVRYCASLLLITNKLSSTLVVLG